MISALQIQYGLPELRKGNFVMGSYSPINKGIFQGFLALPFMFELKIFSDWTFTKTALDIFQWIKFETIYGNLFIAKCANKGYIAHPLGKKAPFHMKLLLGFGGLVGLIVVIAGPLLLFSTLNPLAESNPVLGARIILEISANITDEEGGATNTYELFRSDRFLSIGAMPDKTFEAFSGIREVTDLDRDLFQQVMFEEVSDNTWDLSPPAQKRLYDKLFNINTSFPGIINLELTYAFEREQPPGQLTIQKKLPIVNVNDENVKNRDEIIQKLTEALDPEAS